MIKLSGFGCIQLEGAAAIGAHVIEAALWFAGIDDLLAATLRTRNDIPEKHSNIVDVEPEPL